MKALSKKEQASRTLAAKRVGTTSEERLRWVVRFSQLRLDALRPGELAALADDLRALTPSEFVVRRAEQRETLARDLHGLLGLKLPGLLRGERWDLPERGGFLLLDAASTPKTPRFRLYGSGTEEQGVIFAVTALLLEVGRQLRACKECRVPFVAHRRQEYCTVTCSQRFRNREKDERRRRKDPRLSRPRKTDDRRARPASSTTVSGAGNWDPKVFGDDD